MNKFDDAYIKKFQPMGCPKGTVLFDGFQRECVNKEQLVDIFDGWLGDVFSDLQRGARFERYEPDTGYGGGWALENIDKVQDRFTKDVMKYLHFEENALDDVKSTVASAFDDIESKYESQDDEGPELLNPDRKKIAEKLGGTLFAYKIQDE